MTAKEIRDMTDGEIKQRLEEAHEELWNLRFKHATNQLTNTSEIRRVRKNVARMKTVQRERELWSEYESSLEE